MEKTTTRLTHNNKRFTKYNKADSKIDMWYVYGIMLFEWLGKVTNKQKGKLSISYINFCWPLQCKWWSDVAVSVSVCVCVCVSQPNLLNYSTDWDEIWCVTVFSSVDLNPI